MKPGTLRERTLAHLERLCVEIGERPVGSPGNLLATGYFRDVATRLGWTVESNLMEVVDWKEDGATLTCRDASFDVFPSPYSRGCEVNAGLVTASSTRELEALRMEGAILLLRGEIAGEQLMPKNFRFYNPPEHGRILSLLEAGKPAVIVCATRRNSSLAGGLHPFPLIEDGDFDIPSVFTTDEEGARIETLRGRTFQLTSTAARIPSTAWNVLARKGDTAVGRIVLTAHIDAKRGTPGAIDNATGVTVLLLLAELLAGYGGGPAVELVALNGEDYYAVPGQMDYIRRHMQVPADILLDINIDGAGHREGDISFSFFDLPEWIESAARGVMERFPGIREGAPWPQGDHSIFVQHGIPAIAVSSAWFLDHMETQDVTHTPRDRLEIVDPSKVAGIARAVANLVERLSGIRSHRGT